MKKIQLFVMAIFMMGAISACNDSSKSTEEEAVDNTEEMSEEVETRLADGSYTIDTQASKVKWVGKKVTGQHDGTIDLDSGGIMIDAAGKTWGEVVLDMTSIKDVDIQSEEDRVKLEGHLRSPDFFHVEKYPTSRFIVKDVAHQEGDTYEVTGDLTVKENTEEVSFPATITTSGNTLNIKGDMKFDRTKFDVKYGSGKFFEDLGDKMIEDEVTIQFDVVANM